MSLGAPSAPHLVPRRILGSILNAVSVCAHLGIIFRMWTGHLVYSAGSVLWEINSPTKRNVPTEGGFG